MDIQTKKLSLIEQLAMITDESIITRIEKLIQIERRRKYESDLKPMSLKEFYAMIEESEEDIRAGRVISQQDLEKESEQW